MYRQPVQYGDIPKCIRTAEYLSTLPQGQNALCQPSRCSVQWAASKILNFRQQPHLTFRLAVKAMLRQDILGSNEMFGFIFQLQNAAYIYSAMSKKILRGQLDRHVFL
jgi:hypothetical protein